MFHAHSKLVTNFELKQLINTVTRSTNTISSALDHIVQIVEKKSVMFSHPLKFEQPQYHILYTQDRKG